MTTNITLWSPVPDSNNSAVPTGAPENITTVADLNNIMREMMASVRQWFDAVEFRDFGIAIEPTGTSTTIQLNGGDYRTQFYVDQTVRWEEQSGAVVKTGTITIVDVVTSPGNTVLTVTGAAVSHPVNKVEAGLPPVGMPSNLAKLDVANVFTQLCTFNAALATTDVDISGEAVFSEVAATPAVNWTQGNKQRIADAANDTITFTNPPTDAASLILVLGNCNANTVFGTPVEWPDGVAPSLSGECIIALYYSTNGGGRYYGTSLVNYS